MTILLVVFNNQKTNNNNNIQKSITPHLYTNTIFKRMTTYNSTLSKSFWMSVRPSINPSNHPNRHLHFNTKVSHVRYSQKVCRNSKKNYRNKWKIYRKLKKKTDIYSNMQTFKPLFVRTHIQYRILTKPYRKYIYSHIKQYF